MGGGGGGNQPQWRLTYVCCLDCNCCLVQVLTTSSSSAPQSGSGVTMRTKKKCRVLFSYQVSSAVHV